MPPAVWHFAMRANLTEERTMTRIGIRPKAMARISLLIALGFAVGLLLLPRLRTWAQAEPPKDAKDAPEKVALPTPAVPSAPAAETTVAPVPSPSIMPPAVDVFVEPKPAVTPPVTSAPPTGGARVGGAIGAATGLHETDASPPPSLNELQQLEEARNRLKELAAARQKKSDELKDIEKLYAAAQAKLNEALQKRLKVLEQEANALRSELKAQQIPAKSEEAVPPPQVITGSDSDEQ
jgi:hypothetical protein